ncbi:GTP cyclohydrolase I [Perilla frutescens var. hirtella]|nr:GTP cyclohydrolase I [Perilla frutescens var. hirtella]KAH6810639.1 GTP cyclohydrolase I [Perilla frutescens var. frutescens]
MGALDEGHYDLELSNGVNIELGFEEEPEILAIEEAVKVLLQGLCDDFNREGLRRTPLRVAKALREGTRGYKQKVKDIVSGALFPEVGLENRAGHAGGTGGLVIVRDLDLYSYCESCLLPFQIKCHVGYVPSGQRVVGLSKLSRVAEVFAKRLQNPQRLANEICEALQHGFGPTGVAVILQCSHINFPDFESSLIDPNHKGWVKMLVKSGTGVFDDEMTDVWTDFLSLLRFRGINTEDIHCGGSDDKFWCPSHRYCQMGAHDSAMLSSVASILCSLGEDPLRKELQETPARFVKWLMNFKEYNLDLKLNGFVQSKRDSLASNKDFSYNEDHLCCELNLSFWSQCEHHLLPFHGVVHIGYYNSNELSPVGKSLLQSIVHFYGSKLQVQERLTRQIAETVSSFLGEDIMVVVEASHTCMISRGIEKFGSSTATIAVLGRFSSDASARTKFLQMIPDASPSEDAIEAAIGSENFYISGSVETGNNVFHI